MAVAGYKANVKVTGSPVAFVDEATTELIEGLEYQITDAMKRILEPNASITVEVDSDGAGAGTYVVVDPSTYTLNRLTGTVKFDSAQSLDAIVLISGSYLPLANIAEATEYTYTLENSNEPDNSFGDVWVSRSPIQKDVSASLTRWKSTSTLFNDAISNDSTLLVEFYADNGLPYDVRAWMKVNSDEVNGAPDSWVEESIELIGTTDADGRMVDLG